MDPASAQPPFCIGIDLGTTNCSLAFVALSGTQQVRDMPIPQLTAVGEIEARNTLPSSLYLLDQSEAGNMGFRLPWEKEAPRWITGHFARDHGGDSPGRLVTSAKSWLSHSGVDRTSALLPWHAPEDVQRISPVTASAACLKHLAQAWNHAHPHAPIEQQRVVVTIPASFDEVARELTVQAARQAGLEHAQLLEEPLAAFYDWLHTHQDEKNSLTAGEWILVCDIGGGTTDLTLIESSTNADGELELHRRSVGDHLILGGDNLDLALAHHIEKTLGTEQLDGRSWTQLLRHCRDYKEQMLSENGAESLTVHVQGRGQRMIGGGVQVELKKQDVQTLLLDGFLPEVGPDAAPTRRVSGFREFGLPYATDAGITRYLAEFLRRHGPGDGRLIHPDKILFNGGFFANPMMRERLLNILSGWFPDRPKPQVLDNPRVDLAVSRGAAMYASLREKNARKVQTRLARSYYLDVDARDEEGKPQWLCVAPADMQEGDSLDVPNQRFRLRLRQPVEFPLAVSSVLTTIAAGDLVPISAETHTLLHPLHTVIKAGRKAAQSEVSVTLRSQLSESGRLELFCHEVDGNRSWALPFDLRGTAETLEVDRSTVPAQEAIDPVQIDVARKTLLNALEGTDAQVAGIMKTLEAVLNQDREEWPPQLLRELAETLLKHEDLRKQRATVEARWLNLAGFLLRPGFGFPLDDWRVGEMWKRFPAGVSFPSNEQCRGEWWVLWRRCSGGLSPGQQAELAAPLISGLRRSIDKASREKGLIRLGSHEAAEVIRLLGSLEYLPLRLKKQIGALLLDRMKDKGVLAEHRSAIWALGRLGSRVPIYGRISEVLSPERMVSWIDLLLKMDALEHSISRFALVQMARFTGDRYRDLPSALRSELAEKLKQQGDLRGAHLVLQEGRLDGEQTRWAVGDSLPRGLRLHGSP